MAINGLTHPTPGAIIKMTNGKTKIAKFCVRNSTEGEKIPWDHMSSELFSEVPFIIEIRLYLPFSD